MSMRILRCDYCGNIVIFQRDSAMTPSCCGKKMTLLVPSVDDRFSEKHVPVIIEEKEASRTDRCNGTRFSKKGCCDSYVTVKVGAAQHPMDDDHYIEWIMLETNCGVYTRYLEPEDAPEATFCFCKGEKAVRAYAYCNLHGLWACKCKCGCAGTED